MIRRDNKLGDFGRSPTQARGLIGAVRTMAARQAANVDATDRTAGRTFAPTVQAPPPVPSLFRPPPEVSIPTPYQSNMPTQIIYALPPSPPAEGPLNTVQPGAGSVPLPEYIAAQGSEGPPQGATAPPATPGTPPINLAPPTKAPALFGPAAGAAGGFVVGGPLGAAIGAVAGWFLTKK